ncbi:hypothetical protein [Arthrobacter sp. ISL-5]|uniref:hypothetical protein n=1 Tax=Arthrobacter sp. ISL-5 TaxID=2819111 RepID=UPI001BE73FF3|nr:hypothetical protein [Arthrobacter sp. ISL-5]MBT2555474.1 hypothetical protein [Arthrobacter sp. ISL-5]
MAAVHGITWRIWFNDLARSLGSKNRARAFVSGILTAMVAWTAWSSVELGHQLGLDADMGWQIAAPVAGVVFTMPALATLMAVLYAPSRTLLTEMLSVLPVRQAHIRAAVRWLTVSVGYFGGLLVAGPLALQFVFTGSVRVAVAGLGYALFAALFGCLTTQVLIELGQVIIGRSLGRNGVIVQGISGLLTAGLLLFAFIGTLPMNGRESGGVLLPLGEVFAWLLGGPAPAWWTVTLVAAAPLVMLGVLQLLEWVPRPEFTAWHPILRWRRKRRKANDESFFRLELRQWLCFPSNAVLLLFVNGLCVAAVISAAIAGSDDLGLFYISLGVASALGIGCYGPTRRHHWIYRVAGQPTSWVMPKFMAVFVVWAAMMGFYGTALILFTDAQPVDLMMALPMLFVEMCASCILGLLLPVSRDQSIGGAVSEAVAVIGLIGLTFGLQSTLAASGSLFAIVLVQLMMMIAVVAAYFLTGRWMGLHRSEMAGQ